MVDRSGTEAARRRTVFGRQREGARVQTRRGRNTGTVAKLEARSSVQGRPCSGSEAQDPTVFVVNGEAQVTLTTGGSTYVVARVGRGRRAFPWAVDG